MPPIRVGGRGRCGGITNLLVEGYMDSASRCSVRCSRALKAQGSCFRVKKPFSQGDLARQGLKAPTNGDLAMSWSRGRCRHRGQQRSAAPFGVRRASLGRLAPVARRPRNWSEPAGSDPQGGQTLRVADLVRRGEEILGVRHNPERASRWQSWWSELTDEQRRHYRRVRGRTPRRRG